MILDILTAIYTALTCLTPAWFDVDNPIHNIGVDVCIATYR